MSSISLQTNLNFKQLLDVVKKLTPAEKMRLNEAIWDENMAIPEEHQTLVLKRMNNAKENPERMTNWDEASGKLRP